MGFMINNLGKVTPTFLICLNLIFLLNSFPEAANNYTFVQCAERMRRLRQGMFPATPQNILEFHNLLSNDENQMFTLTLQKLQ